MNPAKLVTDRARPLHVSNLNRLPTGFKAAYASGMTNSNDRSIIATSPRILCVMTLPPDLNGHGGSQRAWRLVEALSRFGEVHLVLIYRDGDHATINTSLTPLGPMVASTTRINISKWRGHKRKIFRVIHPAVADILRFGSFAAPRFSQKVVREIAKLIPLHDPDIIFAGRVTCATVVQSMIDQNLLSSGRKLVDFDDIVSKWRRRQLREMGAAWGFQGRILGHLDVFLVAREERRIARTWNKICVCSDADVMELKETMSKAEIMKVPNTVAHNRLPERVADGTFRCLFVGNLGFPPNIHGLNEFLEVSWPIIRAASAEFSLSIVGFNAPDDLLARSGSDGITVHTNVPDLLPYYQLADLIIAPILFGGGTRVKIVEAMAYGRPVISTSIGAEGLNVTAGNEIFLADTMDQFGRLVVELSQDSSNLRKVAARARQFQQENFGLDTFASAMRDFVS